jgi:hypothetical protein
MPRTLFYSAALVLASYGLAHATVFDYTGGVQTDDITLSGYYAITAIGAAGGSVGDEFGRSSGGAGASASGDVYLAAGTILDIVVGGRGTSDSGFLDGAGGGGGSFAYINAVTPLVVGGGGGGAGNGGDGSPGATGTAGSSASCQFFSLYAGGENGLGGSSGSGYGDGGGGGGFFGNGSTGSGTNPGSGGAGATSFSGGAGFYNGLYAGGGFGGGGGGGYFGGGGGGGYSGGAGGSGCGGGGGGSFVVADFLDPTLNTTFTADASAGNGEVIITFDAADTAAIAVPEPASGALLGAGLAGISVFRRRSAT